MKETTVTVLIVMIEHCRLIDQLLEIKHLLLPVIMNLYTIW